MRKADEYVYEFALEAAVERVFDLFSRPERLNELTPRWFDLRPREPVPERLDTGSEVEYRLRWRGFPMTWISRIVEWSPPHRLTYEQVRGPYRFFRHEHSFDDAGVVTRVRDRVSYRTAGGLAIERLLVRPDLRRIFRHRAQAAASVLAGRDAMLSAGRPAPGPISHGRASSP